MRLAGNTNAFDLSSKGEKVIESEIFQNVFFMADKKRLFVFAGTNGTICINFSEIENFCKELKEIAEVWADVDTEKCLVPNKKLRLNEENKNVKITKKERKQKNDYKF